jgi:hypothetical protein
MKKRKKRNMKLNGNTYVKLDDVIECLDDLTDEYKRRWDGAKYELDTYYDTSPWSKFKIDQMKEKCISRHAQSLACMAVKSSVLKLR